MNFPTKTNENEKETVLKALNGDYKDRVRSELRESKFFDWINSHAKVKEISD